MTLAVSLEASTTNVAYGSKYGMAWHGMAWHGTLWCGMVWTACGMVGEDDRT